MVQAQMFTERNRSISIPVASAAIMKLFFGKLTAADLVKGV